MFLIFDPVLLWVMLEWTVNIIECLLACRGYYYESKTLILIYEELLNRMKRFI